MEKSAKLKEGPDGGKAPGGNPGEPLPDESIPDEPLPGELNPNGAAFRTGRAARQKAPAPQENAERELFELLRQHMAETGRALTEIRGSIAALQVYVWKYTQLAQAKETDARRWRELERRLEKAREQEREQELELEQNLKTENVRHDRSMNVILLVVLTAVLVLPLVLGAIFGWDML